MIKIIKKGKEPDKKRYGYQTTCPYCGCEFVLEHTDFTWQSKTIDGQCGIVCPHCHTEFSKKPSEMKEVTIEEEK